MDLSKLKPYFGKPIASSTVGTNDAKFRGILTSAVYNGIFDGSVTLHVEAEIFGSITIRVESNIVVMKSGETEKCRLPVVDGCIPLEELVKAHKPLTLMSFIEDRKKMSAELISEVFTEYEKRGMLSKDRDTLRVNMDISRQPGCMCGFAHTLQELENNTKYLLSYFGASKIHYYNLRRPARRMTTPFVNLGQFVRIDELQDAFKGDPSCGTYPIFTELNMSWEGGEDGPNWD